MTRSRAGLSPCARAPDQSVTPAHIGAQPARSRVAASHHQTSHLVADPHDPTRHASHRDYFRSLRGPALTSWSRKSPVSILSLNHRSIAASAAEPACNCGWVRQKVGVGWQAESRGQNQKLRIRCNTSGSTDYPHRSAVFGDDLLGKTLGRHALLLLQMSRAWSGAMATAASATCFRRKMPARTSGQYIRGYFANFARLRHAATVREAPQPVGLRQPARGRW